MNILKYGVAAAALTFAGAAFAQTGIGGGLGGAAGGAVGGVTGGAAGGVTGSPGSVTGAGAATGGVTAAPPRTPSTGVTSGADTGAMAGVALSSAKKTDVAMGSKLMGAGGVTLGTVSNVTTDASGKITSVTVMGANGGAARTIPASELRLHNGALMSSTAGAGARGDVSGSSVGGSAGAGGSVSGGAGASSTGAGGSTTGGVR